jgi:putative salt-induced outer membrane protein YdiY
MKSKPRAGFYSGVFLLLVLALSWTPAFADEIVLSNGDRLTGTVVKAQEGQMTIKTEYADAITVSMDKVKEIRTDSPAEIHLVGGEVLTGKIKTTEGKMLAIEPAPGGVVSTVDVRKVASINPPAEPRAKLTGNISLGGTLQSGNTDSGSFTAAADSSIKRERDRFGTRFMFNYEEENDEATTRNLFGALKYDYFFTETYYGYLSVEMQKDRFKDLNLRTVVGPGMGYQVWDDSIKFLLLEAGVAYFSEDRRIAEDDEWITARLAGQFQYTFSKYLKFFDWFEMHPSLEDVDDFIARNEAGILSPIGAGWSLKLSHLLEYNHTPPPDVSKTDQLWTLGLQYSF